MWKSLERIGEWLGLRVPGAESDTPDIFGGGYCGYDVPDAERERDRRWAEQDAAKHEKWVAMIEAADQPVGADADDRATPDLVKWEIDKVQSGFCYAHIEGPAMFLEDNDHWAELPAQEKLSIIFAKTRISELEPSEAMQIVRREVDLSQVPEAEQERRFGRVCCPQQMEVAGDLERGDGDHLRAADAAAPRWADGEEIWPQNTEWAGADEAAMSESEPYEDRTFAEVVRRAQEREPEQRREMEVIWAAEEAMRPAEEAEWREREENRRRRERRELSLWEGEIERDIAVSAYGSVAREMGVERLGDVPWEPSGCSPSLSDAEGALHRIEELQHQIYVGDPEQTWAELGPERMAHVMDRYGRWDGFTDQQRSVVQGNVLAGRPQAEWMTGVDPVILRPEPPPPEI